MTSTIRVSEPRELLALIPHQLGFVPTNSLVLVSLRGPRSRVGLVARVDLDDLADQEFGPQLARSLVAHLDSDRAARCVLVCYVSEPLSLESSVPSEATDAVRNFTTALAEFFPVEGCFLVDPERFHRVESNLELTEPGRCLLELQATAVGAQMVMAGNVVAARRSDLAALQPPTVKNHRVAQRACKVWSQLRQAVSDSALPERERHADLVELGGLRAPRTLMQWRAAGLKIWRHEVERVRVESDSHTPRNRPTTWGRLAAALDDVVVRDAMLLALVVGTTLPEESLEPEHRDSEIAEAIAAILDPKIGQVPNPHVVGPSSDVLRKVVSHAPSGRHAPAATLLALVAWWEGKGAQASVWLEQARGADPEYRLAILLTEAIDSGMPPGWVRR